MAFPPLVSSTPPPLDNFGDSEDDEFGDFATGGIDGLSASSESPQKFATPIRTPPTVSSQNPSPKVNGLDFPEIRPDSILELEDTLVIEKTANSVGQIKLETQSENDSSAKTENVIENTVQDTKSREVFTCNSGSTSENISDESLASPSNFEEPLSLDLGDPSTNSENLNLNLQPIEDFYEVFHNQEEWREKSDVELAIIKPELFDFREFGNEDNSDESNFAAEKRKKSPEEPAPNIEKDLQSLKDFVEDSSTEEFQYAHNIKETFVECITVESWEKISDNESPTLSVQNENEQTQDEVCLSSTALPASSMLFENLQSGLKIEKDVPDSEITNDVNVEGDTEEDDFGDFADFGNAEEIKEVQKVEEVTATRVPENEEDDDFGDFNNFESTVVEERQQINLKDSICRIENKNAVNKIEDIITDLFPVISKEYDVQLQNLLSKTDKVWRNIKNVEETNALTYQWTNSSSNNILLNSLGIDSRNILFGPRWNPNIPRFAANLGFTPLEPVKANSEPQHAAPSNVNKVQSQSTSEEVPAAQFDWNSSGLVNPLEASGGLSALLPLDFLCPFDPLLTSHCSANPETYRRPACSRNPVNYHSSDVTTQDRVSNMPAPKTENYIEFSDVEGSKSQRRTQSVKVIEPLPVPRPSTEWKKKVHQSSVSKSRNSGMQKLSGNVSIPSDIPYFECSSKSSSGMDPHRGKPMTIKKSDVVRTMSEHVVLDRYGCAMSVQPETVKVLNRLPDLSFLSARTLLMDREHRQIVYDLGATINRKMPG